MYHKAGCYTQSVRHSLPRTALRLKPKQRVPDTLAAR